MPRDRPARTDVWWSVVLRATRLVAVIVVTVAVVGLVVLPALTGGAALTVLSGSMRPTISPGDVVVVRGLAPEEVCTEVEVGDVVTYFPEPEDPALVTHRVVAVEPGGLDVAGCRLLTQGDDNPGVDRPVSPEQVRGLMLYGVPYLGTARQWAQEHPWVVLSAAAAAACVLVAPRPCRRRRTKAAATCPPESHPTVHPTTVTNEE